MCMMGSGLTSGSNIEETGDMRAFYGRTMLGATDAPSEGLWDGKKRWHTPCPWPNERVTSKWSCPGAHCKSDSRALYGAEHVYLGGICGPNYPLPVPIAEERMYIRNPLTDEVRNLPQRACLDLLRYGWVWAKADEYRRWIVQRAMILRPMQSNAKH